MELNERLDRELARRFEDLENLESGSDAQGKATENIVKLYKMRMEEEKNNVSKEADEDKLLMEKHRLELEAKKASDDKFIRILTTSLTTACTVGSLLAGAHFTAKGFKFEETGTFCSATMKGLTKMWNFKK